MKVVPFLDVHLYFYKITRIERVFSVQDSVYRLCYDCYKSRRCFEVELSKNSSETD